MRSGEPLSVLGGQLSSKPLRGFSATCHPEDALLPPYSSFACSCSRFGCCCGFFDQRGVLLGHLVHLGNRLIDLFDAAPCSLEAAAISAMMSVTRLTAWTISVIVAPRLIHLFGTHVHLAHRVVDQSLDFLGRGGRTLRQVAHFARDNRKAPALFSGPGSFDGSVKRENIGLEGNAFDDADDVDDLPGAIADRGHRMQYVAHDLAALDGDVGGVGWQAGWPVWHSRCSGARWR